MSHSLQIIARIETDFQTKFGVPRQAGLVPGQLGRIVFEPDFRIADALRGLEGFSHIWLLWDFSACDKDAAWSPTVRPPRLGGNRRMGVFATRSPFRPNHIGLSSVRLVRIKLDTPQGPVLWVEGADLMDGTPIYDIKPYLAFTDSHPEATGGYTDETSRQAELEVHINADMRTAFLCSFPSAEVGEQKLASLRAVLAGDPRPHYQDDPSRIYGMQFAGKEIKFRVEERRLTVVAVSDEQSPLQ